MGATNYNAESLKSLDGLEHVRARPGMYIGSTDSTGLHHLVWELIDNAVDEANEGHGKNIYITINTDGSITIQDEGRGVPFDYNKKEKKNGFELVFQTLNAGGKFDGSNYKTAGGLHGVGASVVNALSTWMEVHSYRLGIDHMVRFENGGKKMTPIKEVTSRIRNGTKITFCPDKKIFSDTNFDFNKIAAHIDDSACLTKGVTFHLKDLRTNREQKYFYEDGLVEYFKKHNANKVDLSEIIKIEGEEEEIRAQIVFQYFKNDFSSEKIFSFVNGVRTSEGGSHVSGFKKALTSCINSFATSHGKLKGKMTLEGDDIRQGMSCIISCWVPEKLLQFEGQTKSKLGTSQANTAVSKIVSDKLSYYLEEHAPVAEAIVQKAIDAMNVKKKMRDARDMERKKLAGGNKTQGTLSGKLSPASSKNYSENELFIVEGDSAGGSAKKCRDREHQAILPLRGKPKNVTSTTNDDDIFDNKELSTLILTIGAGFNDDFNLKNIHYGKIIIMTDADDDGSHIQNLLLSFFYTHMRELIKAGHIYIACPPLYRCSKGKDEIYCWSDEELDAARKKLGSGYRISRYKGLGEMDADQLGKTTMNIKTRRLIQVVIDDEDECSDKVDLFLGSDSDRRKEWITSRIDFKGEYDHLMEVKDEK